MIRVLIASNVAAARTRIAGLLMQGGRAPGVDGSESIAIVAVVGVGHATLIAAREYHPDVVIIDGATAVPEALASARTLAGGTRVLILTADGDTDVVIRAVRAGAAGHLDADLADPRELIRAVAAVHRGGSYISPVMAPVMLDLIRSAAVTDDRSDRDHDLTVREAEVMTLIAEGLSNTAIATRLFISDKTVKNHINRAYAKLAVGSRREAIGVWRGVAVAA